LLKNDIVEHFDLYELSPLLVKAGKEALAINNLPERGRFITGSPFDLPARPIYDLIYWDHSLHHMSDVHEALEWCRASLIPGGVICINDYVGPPRLQWTEREVKAVNAYLTGLEKKHGASIPKATKGNSVRRLRQMIKDPSEAPQSHLIESAARDIFGLALRPLGGAMLNICGPLVMNMATLPEDLIEDFAVADQQCLKDGIYHFAFGIWQSP